LPRLLSVGHVTWDRVKGKDVLGGSVSYASLAAAKLGWEAGVITAAGSDFDPAHDLSAARVFWTEGRTTTRFVNEYAPDGTRRQSLAARAATVDLARVSADWASPDALLLGPVAAELPSGTALAFQADVVGAIAQGWLREFLPDGTVIPMSWSEPARDLAGVHVLFLSQHDTPDAHAFAREMLGLVPIVVLTRGWRGALVLTRDATLDVPTLPRPEVDPTGAGDVFAAAFLLRYHETSELAEAAAFAACAASCVVEGVGAATLGDRVEIDNRLQQRERLIDEGEWDE
jgi:sugar/nucleoside kinase (ribokinase family)